MNRKIFGNFLVFVVLFVVGTFSVCASTIDNYSLSFAIEKNVVAAEHHLESSYDLKGTVLSFPADEFKGSVYAGEKLIADKLNGTSFILPSSKLFSLNYLTRDYLDNENFVMSFVAPADVSLLKIQLILPNKAVLKKPFVKGDLKTGSAYPSPSGSFSDGENIILAWEIKDVKKGQEIPIYVGYEKGKDYLSLALILGLLFVVAVTFIILRRPETKTKIIVKKEDNVEEHLKEDEEQIVRILKEREGHKIEQGTLRVITGFPKATLSRLLKELEDRKVIFKEKRGKKNLVFLK